MSSGEEDEIEMDNLSGKEKLSPSDKIRES